MRVNRFQARNGLPEAKNELFYDMHDCPVRDGGRKNSENAHRKCPPVLSQGERAALPVKTLFLTPLSGHRFWNSILCCLMSSESRGEVARNLRGEQRIGFFPFNSLHPFIMWGVFSSHTWAICSESSWMSPLQLSSDPVWPKDNIQFPG